MSQSSCSVHFDKAIRRLEQIVGDEGVIRRLKSNGQDYYYAATPRSVEQIRECVIVANETNIPLYPVSTGRNWGYSGSDPVTTDSIVLELSEMVDIQVLDRELGIVRVEPGVTQEMLRDFLKREDLNFLVPVHGGGPTCSILGNALERGFGLTPTTDHFASLRSVEVVLADGSTYKSAFASLDLVHLDAAHKWGIGPYLDGLFGQGNFGIVVSGVVALEPIPEHVEVFLFRINSRDELNKFIPQIRTLLTELGSLVTGINLMNDRRVLSMTLPYPKDKVPPGGVMSNELVTLLCKSVDIDCWTGVGILHCTREFVSAARKKIRKTLSVNNRPIVFVNDKRLRLAHALPKSIQRLFPITFKKLQSLKQLLAVANGTPSSVALPVAYWLRGSDVNYEKMRDPGRDGCGLLWYSPLVLTKSEMVKEFVDMVYRVCLYHKIEPLITLTSLSSRHFDCTIPLLFEAYSLEDRTRVQACYDELIVEGTKLGVYPYRLDRSAMEKLIQKGDTFHWRVVKSIKDALDPNDIIAPGRYCYTERFYQ